MDEAGVGITWHSNWSDYPRQASSWSEEPTDSFVNMDAFQWFSYWGDRPIMETVAAMICHNLFGRFSNLKMAIIEHGTVWLPYTLRKLDHAFLLGRRATFGKLEAKPSEIFRKHFIVAPFPEENVSRVLEVIGSDTLVFGSDFPHPEGLADPILYATQLKGLSEADVKAIMRDNTARFLGKEA